MMNYYTLTNPLRQDMHVWKDHDSNHMKYWMVTFQTYQEGGLDVKAFTLQTRESARELYISLRKNFGYNAV